MLRLTNEILEIIKNSKAIVHVINALESKHGKRYKYSTIHNLIKRNNIDVSHFTGQGHAKGKEFGYKFPLEDYLNGTRYINSHELKLRLLKEKIFEHECAICKYTTWYNGQKINLELDHIDGNPEDNSLSNLRVLCPNCHAQTPTYCGKNRKDRKSYFCIDCHKQLSGERKTDLCLNCFHKSSNQQLKSKQSIDKNNDNFKVKRSIEDYLNNIFKIDSYALKNKLIAVNILKHQCSECKLTEWQGRPIPIDLDHIDGNPNNNNLSNLRILCPTCHSYTANYCAKNAKKFKPKTTYKCIKCEKELSCKRQSGCCSECRERKDGFVSVLPKINWGPIEDLIKLVKENNYNYTKVGKILGVSRTAVRNKIKEYEL